MKILILSNLVSYTYHLRRELIEAFIEQGHQVTIAAEEDDSQKAAYFNSCGCEIVPVPFHGKGTSVRQDAKTLITYFQIIRSKQPDVIFTYTIKPNLYGGIATRLLRKNYAPMITGLGEVEKPGKLQFLLLAMHRFVMPHAKCVFFQNQDNIRFFREHKIRVRECVLLPGSGVNLQTHPYSEYPDEENGIAFGFIGRITYAKGIDQFLDAAEYFAGEGAHLQFHVAGKCDEEYKDRIADLASKGILVYHGLLGDTRQLYQKLHCLVLPTFHPEGISNVLLEAAACGRPTICTDRPGCREVVDDGVNGYLVRERDSEDLIRAMRKFLSLSQEERRNMGLAGRAKVEKEFDRQIVVQKYIEELEKP